LVTPSPRFALDDVPLYVPKPPVPRAGGPSHRLFLNENPHPPLPSVVQVISDAAQGANWYPEIAPTELVRALAHRLDVPETDVVTGPGSVGIYQQIGQAMLADGDEVGYAWPSFEAYPIVTRTAGARAVEVPLRDGRHDLAAMAARVTARTRAVFICNPNNPTGTAVRRAELVSLLDQLPPSVLVVLDEAYHEFVRDPDVPDGIDLYRKWPNLLVLRTFSKAYGLAGLRVGYAVARRPIAEALRKCAVPCGVGRIAVQAALASLSVEDELFARVDSLVGERERLRAELLACGLPVPPSEANFLWLGLGPAATDVARRLESEGLLTRLFPGLGIRLTVGAPDVNDLVIKVLRELDTPVGVPADPIPTGSGPRIDAD
jgi:histidinol-phosphate aminotransferase